MDSSIRGLFSCCYPEFSSTDRKNGNLRQNNWKNLGLTVTLGFSYFNSFSIVNILKPQQFKDLRPSVGVGYVNPFLPFCTVLWI